MPAPTITKPQFPNVPQAPGVPPMLRQIGSIQNTVVLLVADALIVLNMFQGPQWGIFDKNGLPVLIGDSVLDVAFRQETRISTAPQEQGAFLSYDKVGTPFDARVTFAKGGADADRNAFLNAVAAVQASLALFTLVMPDITYPSMNVIHYDYRRTQQHGTTLLAVDVWLEQVRVVGGPQFSNTAAPSGTAPTNTGQVQPQTPTPTQQSAVPGGAPT